MLILTNLLGSAYCVGFNRTSSSENFLSEYILHEFIPQWKLHGVLMFAYCAVCRGTVAALEEQERAKRAKHQAACELSGDYAFIPFVVDTLGNLSPDTSSLLARALGKTASLKWFGDA